MGEGLSAYSSMGWITSTSALSITKTNIESMSSHFRHTLRNN